MTKTITIFALLAFLNTAFATTVAAPAAGASAPVVKEVCRDRKDKNGEVKKVCKKVKIHKKHEGKPIPSK